MLSCFENKAIKTRYERRSYTTIVITSIKSLLRQYYQENPGTLTHSCVLPYTTVFKEIYKGLN